VFSVEIINKLFHRGFKYSLAGVTTYLFDLCLVFFMIYVLGFNLTLAIGLGFLMAINLNFLLSYYLVFRGTKQTVFAGYVYYITLAMFAGAIITFGTTYLIQIFAIPLLLARSMLSALVGSFNFLINTFFNFKLL